MSYQLPPERPTTEIGEQVRPTGTSTPWTTIPRRPKRSEAAGSEVFVTVLQHWRSPVEHELAGVDEGCAVTVTVVVPPPPPGMATARRGRAARAKILEKNIVKRV